ncbi:response regulator transcription factor [uncultured Desulfosarcina sp.]|uniref:response regulator transcription factor n=1 Tax=uncultured Desulfosarcina sp. TaxID=218289 RepID=UPI0029C69EE7|nr:response regulator transcription factor [uncultured Desulfosarcina sp.]
MVDDQPSSAAAIRIVIADDHPAVCQGLKLLLEPEGVVVCDQADGRDKALDQVKAHRPDLVLVDLSLGDDNGIDLVGDLQNLAVPALVYSMHEDAHYVKAALAAGAKGYVTKREVHRMLVQAIGEITAGRRFVSPRAALALADQVEMKSTDTDMPDLSGQEKNVYRLLGSGEGTSQIARTMKISARTVESYYSRILVKLELETMRDLRRHAIDHYRKPLR